MVFGTTFGRGIYILYYFVPHYSIHLIIVPHMLRVYEDIVKTTL